MLFPLVELHCPQMMVRFLSNSHQILNRMVMPKGKYSDCQTDWSTDCPTDWKMVKSKEIQKVRLAKPKEIQMASQKASRVMLTEFPHLVMPMESCLLKKMELKKVYPHWVMPMVSMMEKRKPNKVPHLVSNPNLNYLQIPLP